MTFEQNIRLLLWISREDWKQTGRITNDTTVCNSWYPGHNTLGQVYSGHVYLGCKCCCSPQRFTLTALSNMVAIVFTSMDQQF